MIELDAKYAPLPADARAILRQKTLLGETYVELTPGHQDAPSRSPRAARWPRRRSPTRCSSTRSSARSTPRRARRSRPGCRSRRWRSSGHGRDLNDALGNLAPVRRGHRGAGRHPGPAAGRGQRWSRNTGVVFDALSERDGQLRSLIENSNRVFPATASRDEELKQTFIALPTFERESTLTLDRLAEFARDTNPLIKQLRPAARELTPTLQDLGALSPDLEALFQELNPLITASKTGFPALERARGRAAADRPARPGDAPARPDLRLPRALQAGADRVLRQHGGGAPRRRDTDAGVHYLRTTNPLNPENLAVYPRRIGTNRPNPYAKPGNFNPLKQRPAGRSRTATAGCGAADRHQRAAPAAAGSRSSATWSRPRTAGQTMISSRSRRPAAAPAHRAACRARTTRRRGHAVPARQREMTPFERIVRASARRPGRVLAVVAVVAAVGCDSRCGWSRARRPTRSSGAARTRSRPPSATASGSATTRWSCSCGASCRSSC